MSRSAVSTAESFALTRRLSPVIDLPAVGAWVLPFAVILLLAFSGGGYDPIARGQVGIVLWWMILVGAVLGSVSIRGGRVAWVGVGLLLAFAGWSALALTWTESTERTVTEVARVATLVAVLVLGLASQRRVAARYAVNGAACAIAVVCGAAVLSRLQPQLFPDQALYELFPQSRPRLAYPVGYWNLLAGLAVMGLPLLLAVAGAARTTLGRAAATAALPVVALCIFLTISRGALLGAAVTVPVFLLLAPDRLAKLALGVIAGLGTAVLCVAADRRDALQQNVGDALSRQQGDELLGLVVLVCAGALLLAAGVALADRHASRPGWSRPGRRLTAIATAALVVVGVVVALTAGAGGYASERFEEFKQPAPQAGQSSDDAISRLQSVSANGRYQYWQAAQQAERTNPLRGIGPGTFEFWWAREGTITGGFIRDAHSLWFDALAETGFVGLGLIAGFFLLVVVAGAGRALRAADPEHRIAVAAATAGVVGFIVCASLEWAWEMTVLPAATLLLAAIALAGRADAPLRVTPALAEPKPRLAVRLPLAGVALAALVAIGIPTAAASDLRDSQVRAADGDLTGALERAQSAAEVQPYAAAVRLQEALVLEQAGELRRAVAAARIATQNEPTNWRTWLVRSRLEARTGGAAAALRSYERARTLNPRSLLFVR